MLEGGSGLGDVNRGKRRHIILQAIKNLKIQNNNKTKQKTQKILKIIFYKLKYFKLKVTFLGNVTTNMDII